MNDPGQSTYHETKRAARHVAKETRAEASRVAEEAGDVGRDIIERQRGSIADGIGGFASAIHVAASELEKNRFGTVAGYVHSAGDSLDSLAGNLRDEDLGTLTDRVSDFARRQPALFIGGAVAAGFIIARLMSASAKDESSDEAYTSADLDVPDVDASSAGVSGDEHPS